MSKPNLKIVLRTIEIVFTVLNLNGTGKTQRLLNIRISKDKRTRN